MAHWAGAEPGLREMDEYGGTDEKTERRTWRLLKQLRERLYDDEIVIPEGTLRAILDNVVPCIAANIPVAHDLLLDLAYGACQDGADLCYLAERLQALDVPWLTEEAIHIYRVIGDNDSYLALRLENLESGFDYLDLATFYWQSKGRAEAVETARQGLALGRGAQRELRAFLAERAQEAGNRAEYVDLEFAQATDDMTVESYTAFKELCASEEWADYELRVLAALEECDLDVRMEIHILRKEYDQAVTLLPSTVHPFDDDEEAIFGAAAKLEAHFPEKLLAFCQSALGPLDSSGSRPEYRRRARVLTKVRHMWVDVLQKPDAWLAFARRVQALNGRRPACEEEFAWIIPGWREVRTPARPPAGPGDDDAASAALPPSPSLRQMELSLPSSGGPGDGSKNGAREDARLR